MIGSMSVEGLASGWTIRLALWRVLPRGAGATRRRARGSSFGDRSVFTQHHDPSSWSMVSVCGSARVLEHDVEIVGVDDELADVLGLRHRVERIAGLRHRQHL